MDCPTEENDIRKALAGIDGIRALRFELSARTITIDADALALEAALAVIRQAGFEPEPLQGDADRSGTATLAAGAYLLYLLMRHEEAETRRVDAQLDRQRALAMPKKKET